MAHLLRVPEVATGTTEVVLAAWPVAENSPYSAADVIATVETDKAVIDIEAEESGVILRRLAAEGAVVTVGQPIALIGKPGEPAGDFDEELRAQGIMPQQPPPATSAVQAPGRTPDAGRNGGPASTASRPADPERIFVSPLARRLARAGGLALRDIPGTGPNGRILRRDVERAVSARAADLAPGSDKTPAAAAAPVPAAWTDVPHSRVRRAIASRLTESKHTVPHFYLSASLRAGKLVRLRAELNEGGRARISLNDLVIKAAARAHQLVPAMNVIWTPDALRSFAAVDIGVAIASPRGLVTPVLRSVDSTGIAAVAAAVSDLADRAGSGRLQQRELEGGTITVTNLGMFGTEQFAAIINPPQSAILAVGAVRSAPVVKKGKLAVGAVMAVTLAVDHRAADGRIAAEWMTAFAALIEHPAQILL
ncbi:MAG TPA: dihydrolipoamide acetyltransferase family protein [Streptosporangiaceae bacterium]